MTVGDDIAISMLDDRLRTAVNKGKETEARDPKAAAPHFEEAARWADKIAGIAKGDSRVRAMEQATKMRTHAADLREGRVASPPKPKKTSGEAPKHQGARSEQQESDDDPAAPSKFLERADTTWDDIVGLTDAKKLLKGAVLLAVAKPPVGVKLDPPAGILLYGPPGTGKTMLAKAASNMLGASFFNLPGGEIENKWYGESSKIVKRVFEEARVKSPSIVFLDEIDTLVGKRDAGSERDPSKSILGTLLTEMEGATTSKGKNPPMVLVLAGTNQPMNLDPAFLTRFNRRVMIPLPDENARSAILAKQITARGLSLEVPLESIVARTEGYSGRELRNLAQEMIRLMVEECNTDLYERVGKENLAESSYKVGPITHAHVERALHDVRAVTSHEAIVRLEEWARGGIS